MAKNAQEAYDEIVAYINSCGGGYSSWYAGVTQNAHQRLFNAHNVSQQNGAWIWVPTVSSMAARSVEKALLELGCDGGTGGGDDDAVYVYAYRKTSSTDP